MANASDKPLAVSSTRKASLALNAARKKWNTAVAELGYARRNSALADLDPFLKRFTVTGRATSEEYDVQQWTFRDLFTKGFWQTFVINPSEKSYFYLSIVVMFAVLYNATFIILRAAYPHVHHGMYLPIWFTMDYLSDTIYVWDMFMQSRLGFLEQGLLVRDTKRLRMKYIKSLGFCIDAFCVLPFEFFYFMTGIQSLLRLNRLFKSFRLLPFYHLAETHTSYPNLMRVAFLIMGVCIFTHWAACIYYVISEAIGFGSDMWVYEGDPEFWTAYLSCFYWSLLTLTTIGANLNPETSVEYLFCIVCNLLGVLLFATVFGNIGAMINQVNAARTEFQNQVDSVKRYMELRQIDEELQIRVVKWFDYTWSNKQSTEDQEALACLPEKLRAEIAIHVHMETLRKVAIFQDCEPGLLVELVLKLRLQVFSPGDFICRKGDIGKEMYIVKRGKLQVVSEDGKKTFATLSAGSVFGEVSILNITGNKTGNRRTASVKSVGYSDLFCLSKHNLWDALKEYPEAKKMLAETGKEILRKDNLLDEEAAKREEKKQEALNNKVDMIADAVEEISKQLKNISASMQKHSTVLIPVLEADEPLVS